MPRLVKSNPFGQFIDTAEIADLAVTTAKIADGNVTAVKVAADVATQAEIDAANFIGAKFNEEFTAATSPGVADAWEDWDISATVGAGVRLVFILLTNTTGVAQTAGVRTNGSGVARSFAMPNPGTNGSGIVLMVVETDAAGIIERFSGGAAANITFRVVGWL